MDKSPTTSEDETSELECRSLLMRIGATLAKEDEPPSSCSKRRNSDSPMPGTSSASPTTVEELETESRERRRKPPYPRRTQEPSSSCIANVDKKNRIIERLQQTLRERDTLLEMTMKDQIKLLLELQECVECPVCFNIPRSPPVPCCPNGHVICTRCREKIDSCPTCRTPMSNCVSQVAATVITKIQHPCDFRDEGCTFKADIDKIDGHESECPYRLVHCPHWACDEDVSLVRLTSHVVAAECGDNYTDKPLPYKEEMEYARALDDAEGNGFWRPSLLQFDSRTFYLQVEKCGKTRNWYFYLQMEGSRSECERYFVKLAVCKAAGNETSAVTYNGPVTPIDIKGSLQVDAHGSGLNIRDAVMEKIFVQGKKGEDEDEDDDRYKFWVTVDIFKV